ncbi:L-ascorbate metabolism protein UlaG, beta-lactamase superfamily [Pasteurella testudinis DSM 23072]|uniref:L-ascorbate metabolism protein UlaG, beta-lactamase superfamily n=1 Tax=Pasteurella testudinis DSM 23072 TaxID=1122938 RepID=A0A1W1V739_9PAST|nr:MBL fold metallo-hydrolase [Pasteurella testudinis]SMB89000.1 L-ascorbate metabolism protein UlaG, beta-lactamase superfamily [Pasteurella testudinis DSM 23072]SUB50231.1 Probable L-ascorbate-6-phosphate lactonase ulaG [Pasteurella testudinis]
MKKWHRYSLYTLTALAVTAAVVGCQLYRNIGALPDEARFARLDYYRDGRFHNLYDELVFYPEQASGKGGWLRHSGYAPAAPLPMRMLGKSDFAQAEDFAYYWLGHSSAILELGGQRLLIDPVFDNAAPIALPFVVPRFQAAPIARQQLPAADIVLITHDHYDHLEAATIRHLAKQAAVPHFVAPLGVGTRLQSWGVPSENITELGWGDSVGIGGLTFHAETALHYSARWRNDRDKTLWASFVIEGAGKRLFWSGDSGYGRHFAEIGRKYRRFDLAFIEIDAANPGWPNTHMFPEQAVQAALDLNAARMLPIHWGVFSLGRTPWNDSINRTAQTAQAHKLPLDVPKMGEKYQPQPFQNDNWWRNPALLKDGQ